MTCKNVSTESRWHETRYSFNNFVIKYIILGAVDAGMMPTLGYLVDVRHESIYGTVYSLGNFAFCVAYAFGTLFQTIPIILIATYY